MAVTISDDDYVYFVERAVRGMADIVAELGDELACAKPDVPGANTAYGLLTDTDNTGTTVRAWYGDIQFLPGP